MPLRPLRFRSMADSLVIDSVAEVELDAVDWPIFDVAASAICYPFRYSDDEWTDLGALTIQQYPDPAGRLRDWARAFVRANPTDTLALLKDLSAGVAGWISYQSREDRGHAVADPDAGSRLGILPGFRGPLRRSGAQPGLWGEDRFRVSLPAGP